MKDSASSLDSETKNLNRLSTGLGLLTQSVSSKTHSSQSETVLTGDCGPGLKATKSRLSSDSHFHPPHPPHSPQTQSQIESDLKELTAQLAILDQQSYAIDLEQADFLQRKGEERRQIQREKSKLLEEMTKMLGQLQGPQAPEPAPLSLNQTSGFSSSSISKEDESDLMPRSSESRPRSSESLS